ncbi:hypothetical protein [Vibrio parahaemolyticus]|uniref:hypothetical protein n=1 Tax=Vibrio parahaemolyticus TaxID=670 RepID=UPI0012AB9A34|nr:hypothetical protein [Vibrio parahaemolyticus]
MFGFEYFLEEISKANPFVYPYGCIQSKLTSIEGIATKESNRPITYYSVFDGDTTSKGKGVDFWAATDAQKRALVSNPDHNIYLLDDGRLVQWRVRQRTIAGAGNGKWADLSLVTGNATLYSTSPILNDCVQAQGSSDSILTPSWARTFVGITHNSANHKQLGVWELTDDTTISVDGHCYFHVCGVVPRLNQGAYHPSFNPMGSASVLETTGRDWSRKWYAVDAVPLKNTADCFDFTGANRTSYPYLVGKVVGSTASSSTLSGSIAAGDKFCGRPDGKFYDAIYASGQGGVIDYRLSACDMGSKEEASKIFQKVVNGTYRGEELLTKTKVFGSTQGATYQGVVSGMYKWNASAADFVISDGALGTSGASAPIIGWLVQESKVFPVTYLFQASGSSTTQIYCGQSAWENTKPNGVVQDIVSNKPMYFVQHITTNIPVSGDFTQVDVVGSPAKILATPALANGWLGGWIPVIPDGTSKECKLTRKGLEQGTTQYTTDNGVTWFSTATNYNITTNSFTSSLPVNRINVYNYTAFAKQTKVSTNKVVLNQHEGLGLVTEICHSHLWWSVKLAESLMGKVCTSSAASTGGAFHPITRLGWERGAQRLATSVNDPTVHSPITMPAPSNNSPAVKALWYQTADNQQCSLNFAWNELVYKPFTNPIVDTGAQMLRKRGAIYLVNVAGSALNGRLVIWNGNEASIPVDYTAYYVDANNVIKSKSSNAVSTIQLYTGDGWGDDSTVRIIDGIGTFINLNGDTCLYGTHELAIPYGYTKNKARAGSQVSGVDL